MTASGVWPAGQGGELLRLPPRPFGLPAREPPVAVEEVAQDRVGIAARRSRRRGPARRQGARGDDEAGRAHERKLHEPAARNTWVVHDGILLSVPTAQCHTGGDETRSLGQCYRSTARAVTAQPTPKTGDRHALSHAREQHAQRLGHRARPHVHVGRLRQGGRRRVDRRGPQGARPRRQLRRLLGHVRLGAERRAARPRDQGPARSGRAHHQVRPGPEPGRQGEPRRRQPRPRGAGVRREPEAARRRRHRPLLPAPRRPQGADRGHGGRDGAAGRSGQGPLYRPVGGRARHHRPGARRASHQRRADRVLAPLPESGRGDAAHLPRSRHLVRRVLAARPGLL